MFRRTPLVLALCAGLSLLSAPASAASLSLIEAYRAALANDSAYRAAVYANESGQENRILGRSNLLPSLSASYSGSKAHSDITYGSKAQPQQDYISRSANVQLRQSLFSLDAWARYKQGGLQSDYSSAVFLSEQQQVIMRTVSAYIELLFKEDQLALAQWERDTYVERMKANDRLFAQGEGTRTDMLETRARLDVAEAGLLDAQDNLYSTRLALEAIVGGPVESLDHLTPEFNGRVSEPMSFDAWKRVALERNPDLKAKLIAVEINQQEINKARAGHLPRMDLVATYGKNTSESINTINQDSTTRSIGIQLNIPLYSGGAVNASTRQAVANKEKALADLQAEKDKQLLELRKNFDSLTSSAARIDALMKAVESGRLLVKATEQSIKGGIRINLELLDAQRQLSSTQRDLAQARYTYVLAHFKLRAAAGTLGENDVREISAYFR
ncbi:TolC family outer membrane protein [Pseudoduganella danionis]|uniref:TolC family outer membrane protein n=2 Tax=Pseudoduganella danionis TaxID=1890295 RepID=A0ABW9SJE4_9BURK|nr:TolC family outer membrane protein [Pseudoduganella danionis]